MREAAIGIVLQDDKVLLVKRRDVPVWVLPGGGIDEGESPEMAATREVQEETGLTTQITRKVGTWLPINRIGSKSHVFELSASCTPETLHPQKESQEVKFFSLNALPATLFFLHKTWLQTALKKQREQEYVMHELTYWRAFKTILQHPIYAVRYLLSRLGLPLND